MKDIDKPILACVLALLIMLIFKVHTVEEEADEKVVLSIWPMSATGVPIERWGSGVR